MSGQYRPGYPGQGSQGNQPVSFKTDINRKKTKKWVAAKSYSYDGDDWGDDDDDEVEEEDEEVPALPDTSHRPTLTTHQAAPSTTTAQPPANVSSPTVESPSVQSPAFVRPADIYKRMQESNEKTPISQEPIHSNPTSPEPAPAPLPAASQDFHHNVPSPLAEESVRSTSPLVIPEVKRLSGFDQDFFGNTNNPAQAVHGEQPRAAEQENPAAEASAQQPPTNFKPGHRRDLSVPSPGNGPDRLPTVAHADESQSAEVVLPDDDEEHDNVDSSAQATPRPLSTAGEAVDNSVIQRSSLDSETKPSSEEVHSPVPTPLDIPEEHMQNIPQIVPSLSTETSPQDMESDRLRKEIMRSFSSEKLPATDPQSTVQSGIEEPNSQARQSTYLPSEYDNYWNDQQGIPPTSPLQLRSAAEPPNKEPEVAPSTEPVADPVANPIATLTTSDSRPKLKKRFSWEDSDDSDEGDVIEEPSEAAAPSQPVQTASAAEEVLPERPVSTARAPNEATGEDALEAQTDFSNRQSLPKTSIEGKEVVDSIEQQHEEPQGELSYVSPSAEQDVALAETHEDNLPAETVSRGPVNEASLPSFRKIMEISSSAEKIRVFNETREQFAVSDSGLSDWIRRSSESLPEHADLIQANGRLPGGAPISGLPPKAKFPKLSSLGNLSLPTSSSHTDGSSSSGFNPTHVRRSSGTVMNRQNVELKGKDLLHSAGVLGGKAGGAARGLFAKGKSKLRGADKVD